MQRPSPREDKEHDGVQEMVKNRLLPDGDGLIPGKQGFETMRAKRTKAHGQET